MDDIAEKKLTKEQKRYRNRIANGMCCYSGCKSTPESNKRACKHHLDYYNMINRRIRNRLTLRKKKEEENRRIQKTLFQKIGELISKLDDNQLSKIPDEIRHLVLTVKTQGTK